LCAHLDAKFTEYLSNAATITSLVLALVAIFYSFIANDGLSKSLGNISTVASEVKEARGQISDYLELAKEPGDTAKQRASLIRQVSDVGSNLAALTGTLGAIKTQTDALHATIATLPFLRASIN
jgi:hypothetical protein